MTDQSRIRQRAGLLDKEYFQSRFCNFSASKDPFTFINNAYIFTLKIINTAYRGA